MLKPCHQQVNEVFPDPSSQGPITAWSLVTGCFRNAIREKSVLKPLWKTSYLVLLTMDAAA